MVAGVLAFALVTVERAQARSPEADRLYQQGKAALKLGQHTEALERFRACLALVGDDERDTWQLLLAVALTHEQMGRLDHAVEVYRRFLDRTEGAEVTLNAKWASRRETAAASVTELDEALMATHGFISVISEPPGAGLFVDGVRAGADGNAVTPWGVYLREGRHTLRVELADRLPVEATVDVVSGQLEPLLLTFESVAAPTIPSVELPSATEPNMARIGQGLLMGLGGAMLVGAGALSGVASGAKADLRDYHVSQGHAGWDDLNAERAAAETSSFVLYAIGGLALSAGIAWLVVDLSVTSEEEEVPAVGIAPVAHGGLMMTATWRR